MPKYELPNFIPTADHPEAIHDRNTFAMQAQEAYLKLQDIEEVDPTLALWWAHAISRRDRSAQHFNAGWCMAEVALSPHAEFTKAERGELLEEAGNQWRLVYDPNSRSLSDMGWRAKWAVHQLPSLDAIVNDRAQYRHDLDMLAVDLHDRLRRRVESGEYLGVLAVKRRSEVG